MASFVSAQGSSPDRHQRIDGGTPAQSLANAPALWQRMVAASLLMRWAITNVRQNPHTEQSPDKPDAAVADLAAYGFRAWGLMRVRVARMSRKPPGPEISALLALAFSCLQRQYRAAPIVIDQAVEAARALGGAKSASFVNAILRRITREPQAAAADQWQLMALANAPPWLVQRLLAAGSRVLIAHCAVAARPPVFALRYLGAPAEADHWQQQLAHQGHTVHWAGPRSVIVDPPCPVQAVPGFDQGLFRVQDLSAQKAFGLLPLQAGQKVLDVCAAPGGKTLLLAEQADVAIWATDQSEKRLRRLETEWARLSHRFVSRSLHLVVADMSEPVWPDSLPPFFDHIVLDAPCSGTGVVRRHPEIAWTRSQADLNRLVRLQAALLRRVWGALVPGGQLLYITCSVLPEEGESQIARFLQEVSDAVRLPAPGLILPYHEADSRKLSAGDGFFYARLQKRLGTL
ncbi:MAG: transcription antitermination factor NusB [Burkholderiaceae bacterium]